MRIVLALLVLLVLAFLGRNCWPGSFSARFRRDVDARLARPMRPAPPVTDADVAPLPPLMQTYLRRVGAVGRPRVRNVHLLLRAQMRGGPDQPWMASTADQYEFFDPPARFFLMKSSRAGVPFDVFHRYADEGATFQVRIAGLVPMVDQRGPIMTQSETVTLLNDVVVLAPAAVLELPIGWETTGPRTLRATFTNAGFTVSAELTFDESGDLVGFVSNDRYELSAKEARNLPWSTPLSDYREVNGIRIAAKGDAIYVAPEGEWTYGRFEVMRVEYNVTTRR